MSLRISQVFIIFNRLALMPLLILLTVVTTSMALYYIFVVQNYQYTELVVRQELNLQLLQGQVQQLQQERDIWLTHQAEFTQIKTTGLLAPLDRVYWLDQLNLWAQNWLAVGLTVQFSSEQQMQHTDIKSMSLTQPIFYVSRVHVGLGLQIDSDFTHFIQMLRHRMNVPILVEKCELSMQRPGLDQKLVLNLEQANAYMQCSFLIFRAAPRDFNSDDWR